MYRRYYNEYERRAEELRKKESVPPPPETAVCCSGSAEEIPNTPFLNGIHADDLILLGLIVFLIREGKCDKTLIFALFFIFMNG